MQLVCSPIQRRIAQAEAACETLINTGDQVADLVLSYACPRAWEQLLLSY